MRSILAFALLTALLLTGCSDTKSTEKQTTLDKSQMTTFRQEAITLGATLKKIGQSEKTCATGNAATAGQCLQPKFTQASNLMGSFAAKLQSYGTALKSSPCQEALQSFRTAITETKTLFSTAAQQAGSGDLSGLGQTLAGYNGASLTTTGNTAEKVCTPKS